MIAGEVRATIVLVPDAQATNTQLKFLTRPNHFDQLIQSDSENDLTFFNPYFEIKGNVTRSQLQPANEPTNQART